MDEAGGSRVWAAPCMKWVQTDAQGLAGLWGGGDIPAQETQWGYPI